MFNKSKSLLISIVINIISIGIIVSGCLGFAAYHTDMRESAARQSSSWFQELPNDWHGEVEQCFTIPAMKVCVHNDKWVGVRQQPAGWASKREVHLCAKMVNGKIVLDQIVVGHEWTHVMNYYNDLIINPDDYSKKGF